MSHYLAHATPQNIAYCLIIAVALWGAYKMIIWYAERQPIMEPAPRYPVNPSNAADLLAGMQSLRTPLHLHRNMEGAAQAGGSTSQTSQASSGEKMWTSTPLPTQYWKMLDAAALEAETQRQMMADTLRGSKLS